MFIRITIINNLWIIRIKYLTIRYIRKVWLILCNRKKYYFMKYLFASYLFITPTIFGQVFDGMTLFSPAGGGGEEEIFIFPY